MILDGGKQGDLNTQTSLVYHSFVFFLLKVKKKKKVGLSVAHSLFSFLAIFVTHKGRKESLFVCLFVCFFIIPLTHTLTYQLYYSYVLLYYYLDYLLAKF